MSSRCRTSNVGASNGSHHISINKSFLDIVSKLPRPVSVVEDRNFLNDYSLKSRKLTLDQIIARCIPSNKEALDEFPSSSSTPVFHKVKTPANNPKPDVYLNHQLLDMKKKQIHSLIQVYEAQIKWLSCNSRLWFGQLRGHSASLLVDFSDLTCFSSLFPQYLSGLHLLVTEQLSLMDRVYINAMGTDITATQPPLMKFKSNPHLVSLAKGWMTSLKPMGSCNLLLGLKKILKNSDVDVIVIILCSSPDQNLDIVHDYLMQLLAGRDKIPHFHLVSINTHQHVQTFLKNLSAKMNGHYHNLTIKEDELLLEDSLTNEIKNEISKANEIIKDLENIRAGVLDNGILETLRQLSIVSEWPTDDTFTPPTSPSHPPHHTLTCTSTDWLNQFGLNKLGLNLYDVLAPYAYSQISEYVTLIDRSATSAVYDEVMPVFTWSDGTCKYLHIDVHRLNEYMTDLKTYIKFIQSRIAWLTTGSRVIFGNISEKRIILLLDTSVIASLHLTELQHHMKILLQEQICHLNSFNLISYGGSLNEWKDCFIQPYKLSLTEAWKWILAINPHGTPNLLQALHHILESPAYIDSLETIGLYIIVSSVPDQSKDDIRSYLEQKLSGRNIRLNLVRYKPKESDLLTEVTLRCNGGRHGNDQSFVECLKAITDNLGTFHSYTPTSFVESDDLTILNDELMQANDYLTTAQKLLDDYRDYCKRNVPEVPTPCTEDNSRPKSAPPTYPRPTNSSLARLNSTAAKLKQLQERPNTSSRRRRKRDNYLTCHCFYLGKDLKKGLHLELVEGEICANCNKSLIPAREEQISSLEWLSKYSLNKLQLYHSGMFNSCKNGFKHITTDGSIVELSVSHQQLIKILKLLKIVRLRYNNRLQWLLSDTRKVFGCINGGDKVVILIDVSSSMKEQSTILKEQLSKLINEQLNQKRINCFNIAAFSTEVFPWQPNFVANTRDNRSKGEKWIRSLTFEGSSGLLNAIKFSLNIKGQSIYLITDGDTDHTDQFIISQVEEFKQSFNYTWRLNTISYTGGTKRESRELLKTISQLTNGRYHFYSPDIELTVSKLSTSSGTLEQDIKLGDDLKLLVDEITKADYAISQTLYYLGRRP
jgi:hypothetical protein